ncbi:restriction endonuclease [Burkholderia ubonensis]|uniref:restriction endonuclease n=1 Tax=Burkholderia ubonensis TaxID=101571 RepID=UPI0009B46E8E|nr:restriction endonuclease [Burkholderia ubonensis]
MALWLIRAGRYGQHEKRFFDDHRCYLTWDGTEDLDLSTVNDYQGVKALLANLYPDEKPKTRINWASQIAPFVFEIQKGDWIVVPRKTTSALAFAEVTNGYAYDPNADETYRHSIKVKWLNVAVPRASFDQDLLYSFGAYMTVCRMSKNNAEARIRTMGKTGWNSSGSDFSIVAQMGSGVLDATISDQIEPIEEHFDVEQSARDQITKIVQARFKGHDMAQLVGAILRAQGFKTHISPPGPDGGIDILAAPGTFGFAEPRICVQVKSHQSPVERTVLDALGGVMKKVNASHGLLVSWGGFKGSVDKEETQQYFHMRLWDSDDLIDELLAVYDKLDADIRAQLPLKRVWTLAVGNEP